ncbi:MAG: carboxymuconolactone decarboxylase family protein [Burkholderiales bacterium]
MAMDGKQVEELKKKYGAKVVETASRTLDPQDVPAALQWAEDLDPHYMKLLLDFSYGGMLRRGILDERTRTLVVVAQFVVMDEMEQLAQHIRTALKHATPREVLEVILQTGVYIGYPKIVRATRVFRDIIAAAGRMDEITSTQLPLEGPPRSLEKERADWGVPDSPLRQELVDKYSWQSLSPGMRLQPTHHLVTMERLDRVDQHFAKLWLDYIYAGMYQRGVLDDKTRHLIVIGEFYVMNEMFQPEAHMRGILALGASPREILEVILQSTIYAGMPRFVRFIATLEKVLQEQGRLAELTDTQLALPG